MSTSIHSMAGAAAAAPAVRKRPRSALVRTLSTGPVMAALVMLAVIVLAAIAANLLGLADPMAINPMQRLKGFSAEHWFGTDAYGRDVLSRVIHGARISLMIGAGTAVVALIPGLLLGVIAGYFRAADMVIMRIMDGIMSVPSILLAIALVAVTGASMLTVLIAIAVPEFPRVVRLVRGLILSLRDEPYVEAAISLGTPTRTLMMRHLVPNTLAPLIVQGTFIFASAMLSEAVMSFLGVGMPPEFPSWGNVIAEGRMYFQIKPELILLPGLFLALTVLSVNMLGDAMRDALDPKMARRV
ncbi:ABC transporter permease [Achromobacter deleyi]|uniref:ABC transporter permease n=1 Tax=Achromobacter deleyi TaxID=1353891 RepID=UPI00149195C7|nr:ABC transporter permease [Achromobacter deleyi]QVQ26020.1 ABC transporter permease [Achromobacter deleyi]UIP21571.1 ABC transporter permease [Achromobacter deleyi]